jgi:hypothetical protein
MHHPLVPLLVLVLIPSLLLLGRGVLRPRPAWAAWGICAALVLVASIAAGGVEFEYLNRMKMLVAVAVAAIVLGRRHGITGLERRRPYLLALAVVAGFAWVIHLNFLSFHGTGQTRVYLHLHDVAHYYLGSKYFDELRYKDLYTAMLRAEAELYDDHFRGIEARDLETNGLYHIRVFLERSGPVKARFTPERWQDFQLDVAYFRAALGPQYADVLRDHGFNPTPVWALIGGTLANLVPAGSHRGILLIALVDPVVEALAFAAVAWAFGAEAVLLSMIYFCVVFGASFGWTGGSHLRHLWLLGVVGGICCAERGRHAAAGALIALAAGLRIFPIFFAFGPASKALAELIGRRRVSRATLSFFAGLALAGIGLAGATLVQTGGWRHWADFTANMRRHVQVDATNLVGLGEIVTWNGPAFPANEAEAAAAAAREARLYRLQLMTVLPLVLLCVAARSRREDDPGAIVLGPLVVFAALSLASYYYVFLLVYLLARPLPARRVVLLFGGEAAIYALALFEDREVVLYLYRNILVAYLLFALHAEALREEASSLWSWVQSEKQAMSDER